jgi:hypothetical protein
MTWVKLPDEDGFERYLFELGGVPRKRLIAKWNSESQVVSLLERASIVATVRYTRERDSLAPGNDYELVLEQLGNTAQVQGALPAGRLASLVSLRYKLERFKSKEPERAVAELKRGVLHRWPTVVDCVIDGAVKRSRAANAFERGLDVYISELERLDSKNPEATKDLEDANAARISIQENGIYSYKGIVLPDS